MRRPAEISDCPHENRKHFARGMCKSCYNASKLPDKPSASAIRGKEFYAKNRTTRIYGDGITTDAGAQFFAIASDPNDDLIIGSRYVRRDFLASLLSDSWPDGLIIKDQKRRKYTVKFLKGFDHAFLKRPDGTLFQPTGKGHNYRLVRIENGKGRRTAS